MDISEIEKAIVKHEVYAFRKGSLLVFFRIYLDRRKIQLIIDTLKKEDGIRFNDIEEVVVSNIIQRDLRSGISQFKITGKEQQIIIDPKSIYVTNEFDALIDYDVTDIKTSGIIGNRPSPSDTNNFINETNSTILSYKETKKFEQKPPPAAIQTTMKPYSLRPTTSSSTTSNSTTFFHKAIKLNISTLSSIENATQTATTIPVQKTSSQYSNKNTDEFPFTNSTQSKPLNVNLNATISFIPINQPEDPVKPLVPFTRKQSTTSTDAPSSSHSSTNVKITTRTRVRSSTSLPSFHTTTRSPSIQQNQNQNQNQNYNHSNAFKIIEPKQSGPKFSSIDFGQWKPVIQTPKPVIPLHKPPPLPLPPQIPTFPRDNIPHHLHPSLQKPPPHLNLNFNFPPQHSRPAYRIPMPVNIGMHEVPRLMDSGGLNFNFSLSSDHHPEGREGGVNGNENANQISSQSFNITSTLHTTISPTTSTSTLTKTTSTSMKTTSTSIKTTSTSTTISSFFHPINNSSGENPALIDGFLVPIIGTSHSHSDLFNFNSNRTGDNISLNNKNKSDSFENLKIDVRGIRKNKFINLPETHDKQTLLVNNSRLFSQTWSDDSKLFPFDKSDLLPPSIPSIPSLSRPSISELSIGSPVLHLTSEHKSNQTFDKVNTLALFNSTSKDLQIVTPVFELSQPENQNLTNQNLTIGSPMLTLTDSQINNDSNETASTNQTNNDFVIGTSLFINNSSSSGSPTAKRNSTIETASIGPRRKLVKDQEIDNPFINLKRINRSESVSLQRIGKVDREFMLSSTSTSTSTSTTAKPISTLEPVFGERLPKFIPPSHFPKTPNNEINSSGSVSLNYDEGVGLPDALYDDEIVSINQTGGISYSLDYLNPKPNSQYSFTTSHYSSDCSENEFHCNSGECIPLKGYCNRRVECIDGSDEVNCTCSNYLKAERQNRKICDGVIDCWDGSDENQCSWCRGNNTCLLFIETS